MREAVRVLSARGIALSAREARIGWPATAFLRGVVLRHESLELHAREVVIRPSWSSLLIGRLRVSRIELAGARARALHNSAELLLVEAEASWRRVTSENMKITVTAELEGGGTLDGEATYAAGGIEGRLVFAGARAEDLAPVLGRSLPDGVMGAWDGELTLRSRPELSAGELMARVTTHDFSISDSRVAAVPVGPLALGLEVAGAWDLARRELRVRDAVFSVGEHAELSLHGSLVAKLDSGAAFEAQLELMVEDGARLGAVLPPVLRPPAEAPQLVGPLTGAWSLRGRLKEPETWVVAGKLDLAAMKAKARASASPLRGGFSYRALGAKGGEREVIIGHGNRDYVPLAELPRHIGDAVLASEDAGFYAHQGFDFDEIKQSALAVAQSGRAVRGGSTITQQLAKNLYLSREKTYARKVREAQVTLGLESSVSKARLLEIYLNAIEWGPGVYGIGAAAKVYFGKDARELSAREAAFLASIIPSPVSSYARVARGELGSRRADMLEEILTRMSMQGRLDEDAYLRALRDQLIFRTN